MAKFKGRYEVEDGYMGKSAPQYFTINECDLEDDMTEEDIRNFYQEEMDIAFGQTIYPIGRNEDEFVEWAKEQIAARGDE